MTIDIKTITDIDTADAALTRTVLTLQIIDRQIKMLEPEILAAAAEYDDVKIDDAVLINADKIKDYSVRQAVLKRRVQPFGKDFRPWADHRQTIVHVLSTSVGVEEEVMTPRSPLGDLIVRTQTVLRQRAAAEHDWAQVAARYGDLLWHSPSGGLKMMDGLYVGVWTSRRHAQGWATTSGRNKSSFTVHTDRIGNGMLPYSRMPYGYVRNQAKVSVRSMYRRAVDMHVDADHQFLFPAGEDLRFSLPNLYGVRVLLPRAMASDRRRAIPRYIEALIDVRKDVVAAIIESQDWEKNHRGLLTKQNTFDTVMKNLTNPPEWGNLGYGADRDARREFLKALISLTSPPALDMATKVAERAAWAYLGGSLSDDDKKILAGRPVVDDYHGDEEWVTAISKRNLPEMVW